MRVIDSDALVDFALRLVHEQSLSGQESSVARLVRSEMERLGYSVEVDELGNVIGTIEAGPGPCLLLDAHMDTVGVTDPTAWSKSPYGELVDGRLYGRGAMDMKGPLAAAVYGVAAAQLRRGRVVVSASVCEELVEGPALMQIAERLRPTSVVICEATGLGLARGQRGRAEVTVEVEGRPTHSSRPELGVNAAEAMADVIVGLRRLHLPHHDVLGPAILVLTDVISRPYPGLSVVPDHCTATFDRRTLPGEGEEQVLGPVRDVIAGVLGAGPARGRASIAVDNFQTYTGARVQAPNFAPAWCFEENDPVVRTASEGLARASLEPRLKHYAFCTNGSATAGRLGIPTVGFGPGAEELAHRVDEHIELRELEAGGRGYAALAEAFTRA